MVDRPKKPSAIPVSPLSPSPKVSFSSDNSQVHAVLPTGESITVLLHGATVISWKSGDHGTTENLWLSDKAVLDGSKPVRGGIPLVFPVFGPPPKEGSISALSQHGFARSTRWEYLNKSTSEGEPVPQDKAGSKGTGRGAGDNNVTLDFGLSSAQLSPEARKAWPYQFGLIYSITLTREGLETTMLVRNEGKESFEFQCLLHTYFRVGDINDTKVLGLEGAKYVDKVKGGEKNGGEQGPVTFDQETDRIYTTDTSEQVLKIVAGTKPRFEIVRDNLSDAVVWNPWVDKAKGMSDFGPADGWKNMVCVEAGAVNGWQKLDAGDTFEGGQILKAL